MNLNGPQYSLKSPSIFRGFFLWGPLLCLFCSVSCTSKKPIALEDIKSKEQQLNESLREGVPKNIALKGQVIDCLAGSVNGEPVLKSDLKAFDARSSVLTASTASKSSFDALLQERMLLQDCAKLSLLPKQAEIDEAVSNLARQNSLSLEQLYESLAERGLSEENYQDYLRSELCRRNIVYAKISKKIHVAPEEIDQKLGQKKAGIISEVFVWDLMFEVSQKEEALLAFEKLRKSRDFLMDAKIFAAGSPLASLVERGYVRKGQLSELFERAVFGRKVPSVVPPFSSEFGQHLFFLEKKRKIVENEASNQRKALQNKLYMREVEKKLKFYLRRLKKRSKIEAYPTCLGKNF